MKHVWSRNLMVALFACTVGLAAEKATAAATYVDVEFTAIRDTIRDTTVMYMMAVLPMPESEDMTFRIYAQMNETGLGLWHETQQAVPIGTDGRVRVLLGSVETLSSTLFDNGQTRFLEVEIDETVLTPRIALVSAEQVLVLTKETSQLFTGSVESPGAEAFGSKTMPGMKINTSVFFTEAGSIFDGRFIGRPDLPLDLRNYFANRRFRTLIATPNHSLTLPGASGSN